MAAMEVCRLDIRARELAVAAMRCITEALAHHGHHVVSAAAQVSAVLLPDDLAARFSLPTGSPWLLVREQCVTATGRRVLYAEDYHSGPHFTYQVLRRR